MIRSAVLAALVCSASPLGAQPLSAIDWLSDSVAQEQTRAPAPVRTPSAEESFHGVPIEQITVMPLGAPDPDTIGLVEAARAGLPRGLWGPASSEAVAQAITEVPVRALPAVQTLMHRILLARLDAPRGGGAPGLVLRSRIDAVLARGNLEAAEALMAQTDATAPEMFRRAFDVALLTGEEDRACAKLRDTPGIAPSVATRIFCLARGGDWPAAALTLDLAQVLGQVTREEDLLLARFLDADLAESDEALLLPAQPSPLTYRMLEAIGEMLPTRSLPLAFAHADLRSTAGWKTRIDAAERLVKSGGIGAARLFAIYGERDPAASGGVWDRVAGVQAVDAALAADADDRLREILPKTWRAMVVAGLAVPFAEVYGAEIADRIDDGPEASLAARIGLLSSEYQRVAEALRARTDTAEDGLLIAVARGLPPDARARNTGGLSGAVARAFSPSPNLSSVDFLPLIREGRQGEAVLASLKPLAGGRDTDPLLLSQSLAHLRYVGQEDIARRAALQLLILGPGT